MTSIAEQPASPGTVMVVDDNPANLRLLEEMLQNQEIARNVVESQRLSTLIDYATAAPFAIGFLETALAIEDSSNGIWR